MGTIHIKELFLRANIGFSEHELGKLQDVVIDLKMTYDSAIPEQSDIPSDALDYKTITKKVVALVEKGRFNLLESLTRQVLDLVMANQVVLSATVEISKPHALRFAENVSFTLEASRHGN
jgi:D-erythro-7,8-dihydroneopterin triphosphate epimerase